jgi:hypothetical protein
MQSRRRRRLSTRGKDINAAAETEVWAQHSRTAKVIVLSTTLILGRCRDGDGRLDLGDDVGDAVIRR